MKLFGEKDEDGLPPELKSPRLLTASLTSLQFSPKLLEFLRASLIASETLPNLSDAPLLNPTNPDFTLFKLGVLGNEGNEGNEGDEIFASPFANISPRLETSKSKQTPPPPDKDDVHHLDSPEETLFKNGNLFPPSSFLRLSFEGPLEEVVELALEGVVEGAVEGALEGLFDWLAFGSLKKEGRILAKNEDEDLLLKALDP